jgi:hypothetical protein
LRGLHQSSGVTPLRRCRDLSLSSEVVIDKDEDENAHDYEEESDQTRSIVEQRGYAQEYMSQPDAEDDERDFEHIMTQAFLSLFQKYSSKAYLICLEIMG